MYEAEGYAFYSQKDAELATQERKKAEYLKTHIDFNDPESVLRIYKKAVNERIFKTPVGIAYLKEIQMYLKCCDGIPSEEIPAVPLYVSYENDVRENSLPVKNRIQPSAKEEKKKNGYKVSVILNIVLVVAVIAMFAITLNAEHPNILNYERALTNKYSDWEQQLTQREQAIREKELELKLNVE